MATRLTRAELYALVWDRPMTKLAKEFALSDVALHKICRKHSIPTPPQGHWAKKAHGKPLKITALPPDKASGPADTTIVIHEGAGGAESEAMSEARSRVQSRIAAEAPAAPHTPGRIVEPTLARLAKAKADRAGLVHVAGAGLIATTIRPESIDRARLVLEALERTASVAGIELEASGNGAAWLSEGESVSFELIEMPDRFEHVATEAELKAVERWQAKRDETHKRHGYLINYGEPKIPRWEDRYQGRLAVRLEEVRLRGEKYYWGPVIPRSFSDTKTRDLLKMLPKIVSTIAAIAVAKRENREADERRKLAEQETARRRAEQERLAALEKRHVAFLDQLLARHAELRALERLAEELDAAGLRADDALHAVRFAEWLETRVVRLRSACATAALEAWLQKEHLFDEMDGSAE